MATFNNSSTLEKECTCGPFHYPLTSTTLKQANYIKTFGSTLLPGTCTSVISSLGLEKNLNSSLPFGQVALNFFLPCKVFIGYSFFTI